MPKKPSLNISIKSFEWDYLGFGLCRAWITQWMLLPIPMLSTWKISAELLYFIPAACACLVLALFLRGKDMRKSRTLILIVSALLSCIGITLIAIGSSGKFVVPMALGLLSVGIAAALLQTLWGDRLSCLPSNQASFYTVCAFLLSAFLSIFAWSAGSLGTALLLFCALPIGSYILLFRGFRSGEWEEACTFSWTETTKETHDPVHLGRFCISILVFVIVFNFAYRQLLPGASFEGSGHPLRSIANIVVMAALLVVVVATGRFNRMGLYRLSFPVLIGALLLLLFIPAEYAFVASTTAAIGYKLFDVLFWCVLVEIVHGDRKSAWKVLGFGMAANLGGMGLGMGAGWLFELLPNAAMPDLPVVVCLLMFSLVIVVILILPESLLAQFSFHESKKGKGPLAFSFADRCAAVAEDHLLTARERDVLNLLAQGRTQSVIARKLGIGEGTAHTHIVHVYQKLGIHSQQELIDLVEGFAADR